MTDIQAFIEEIMSFLTEEDVRELEAKAGIRFPLDADWTDLYYLCCWMGMKRELPPSVHNRMILCDGSPWSALYLKMREKRPVTIRLNASDLFGLAG